MEFLTCGPGPYTEADVQEAARAFTGWRVHRRAQEVLFFPRTHDDGLKTFMGKTGRFGPEEISDILSALPETATFLSTKLWRFFASPVPDQEVVGRMAQAYLESGGQIAPVMRTLFRSEAFYSDAVAGALVKCPADLVVGAYRVLELPVGREAATMTLKMGQTLYDPPNVAGWPGGGAWLGSSVLLNRLNLGEVVRYLLKREPNPAHDLPAQTPEALVDAWLRYLLDLRDRAGPLARWPVRRSAGRPIRAASPLECLTNRAEPPHTSMGKGEPRSGSPCSCTHFVAGHKGRV